MIKSGIFIFFLFSWFTSYSEEFISLGDKGQIVKKISISEDGKKLLSIHDGSVDFWNLEKSQLIKTLTCSSSTLLCISTSRDFNWIIVGNMKGEVIVINSNYKTKIIELPESGFISSIAIIKNEDIAFAGTENGFVYKLDIQQGTILDKVKIHKKIVTSLSYHSKNRQLISSGSDGKVVVCNGKRLDENFILQNKNGWIRTAGLSKDETSLLFGTDKGTVYEYRIGSDIAYKLVNKSNQFRNWVTGVDIVENDLIVQSSFSGNIKIKFKFGSYIKNLNTRINDIKIIPSKSGYIQLALATDSNGIILLSAANMKYKN